MPQQPPKHTVVVHHQEHPRIMVLHDQAPLMFSSQMIISDRQCIQTGNTQAYKEEDGFW